jgi:hypothetical protein
MSAQPCSQRHKPQMNAPRRPSTGIDKAPDAKSEDRTSMLFTYGIFFARSGGRRLLGWAKVCGGCLALGVVGLTAPAASAEIDFTPRPSTYELEGSRFPNVAFADGRKSVFWTPPVGWKINGSGNRVDLKVADTPQAAGSFSSVDLAEPLGVDEQNTPKFVEALVASLPREISKPEILAVTRNPLRICGHETLDVTVRYTLNGQAYCKSVLFLARGREQLRFELAARENDFAKLHEALEKSLYSIRGL